MSDIQPTPLPQAAQILQKLEELKLALQTAAPTYESLLHQIHQALSKDDEMVHLLTEEQIGVLCAGLSKKKGIVIAASSAKGKTVGGGRALKELTVADIGTKL